MNGLNHKIVSRVSRHATYAYSGMHPTRRSFVVLPLNEE